MPGQRDSNRWNARRNCRQTSWIRWRKYSTAHNKNQCTAATIWLWFYWPNCNHIHKASKWPRRSLFATGFRAIQSNQQWFIGIYCIGGYYCAQRWSNSILFLCQKCWGFGGRKGKQNKYLFSMENHCMVSHQNS